MDEFLSARLQVEEEVLDEAASLRQSSAPDQRQPANEEESSGRFLSEQENDRRVTEEVMSASRSSPEDQGERSDEEMPPLLFSAIEEKGRSSTTSPNQFYPGDSLDDLGNLPGAQNIQSMNDSSSGKEDQSPTTSLHAVENDFAGGRSDDLSYEERGSESPPFRWSDMLIPRPPEEVFTKHRNECDVILFADGRNKYFYMLHDVIYYSHRCVIPIILDLTELRPEWREYLARLAPNVAFPQLWIMGECRGSFTDVVAMFKSKELHELLREVVHRDARRLKEKMERGRAAAAKAAAARGEELKPVDEKPVAEPVIRRGPMKLFSSKTLLDSGDSVDLLRESSAEDLAFEDSSHPNASAQAPGSSVRGTTEEDMPVADTLMELSPENERPVANMPIAQSPEEELTAALKNFDVVLVTEGQGKPSMLMLDAVKCAYDGSPEIINVGAKGVEWRDAAVRLSDGVSFPQLWVTGECKGSLDDVIALNAAGELKDVFRDAGRHGYR